MKTINASKNHFREDEILIARIFNAPLRSVWKTWTDPAHLMLWWGPKNYTSPTCKIDFRVGGKFLFCMRSPEGQDFWSTGVYKTIASLKKIVFTDCFSDDKGNVVHAAYYGMSSDFPLEMQVIVTFEDYEGKTRMILRHVGTPAGLLSDMTTAGWNQSFDKLAESLKIIRKNKNYVSGKEK